MSQPVHASCTYHKYYAHFTEIFSTFRSFNCAVLAARRNELSCCGRACIRSSSQRQTLPGNHTTHPAETYTHPPLAHSPRSRSHPTRSASPFNETPSRAFATRDNHSERRLRRRRHHHRCWRQRARRHWIFLAFIVPPQRQPYNIEKRDEEETRRQRVEKRRKNPYSV